ncbi:glycosyltransferase [Cyanobium sp. WKJ7-Wakatipu]|uniref:glycosyltransferase family 2 protein n=1 Tax=Cyanobium sp. WKJ7-Wakatipu TaxID=2823726 RepID=UPI0020CCD418|nr:glycosyltransferase [Cyanobium sp. WKJ7-Wakatipu]MCP9782347.1 glycosyltransferase [Cyanobium sp. WKJ7-Wakatipu]
MSDLPLVSVILPVHNGGIYLHAAISCILGQAYQRLEIIIIDDGSSDDSEFTIRSFSDPRIQFFKQANQGLAATLNRGITLARGKYIARQDQDDLSNPDRISLQVAYMEDHPDCVLLGSWAQIMEVDRLVERFHRHPVDELMLRYQLLFNNPFVHSSVLLRRSALLEVGGYTTDPERQPPEDYELWSRLSRIGSVANIGEVLLTYREIPGSMSRVGPSPFRRRLIMICAENIAAATGLPSDDSYIRAIAALTHGEASELAQRPDFARMKDILLEAINGLGTGDALLPLRQDAISRVQGMQAAWMIRETPAYRILDQVGPLRSMAKRIWHLTRSLRTPK